MMSDKLSKLKEGDCPVNNLKNNTWILKTFDEEWWVTMSNRYPADPCSEEILITGNKQILYEWLCKFVSGSCKANGQ